jgi:chromosome segregation ATPase
MRQNRKNQRYSAKILLLGLALCPWHNARADQATEQQLRAALQQATSQIAQLQNQVASLQAQEAPDQAQIAALQAQLQTAKGGAGAAPKEDHAAADAQLAAANERLQAQQATLGKLQSAYAQAANIANTNAGANQKLAAQLAALKTQESSCETKNAALYSTGNEILDQLARHDHFWSSLASKEPFIGIERVKLETIVQTDQDKLDDNQIAPAATGP